MEPVTLTQENFQTEVLDAKGTVLVDFWAAWCGPCRMLSPVVDEVAAELSGVKVGKVNIDEQPDLAAQFDVMSIPTLVVFKDGKAVNQSVGVIPKEAILKMVK
ncbi:MAG: thioredoxin [Negativicutes bacterium]